MNTFILISHEYFYIQLLDSSFFYNLTIMRGMLIPEEGVAPTVERWTPNPTVAGSNPVALIFSIICEIQFWLK